MLSLRSFPLATPAALFGLLLGLRAAVGCSSIDPATSSSTTSASSSSAGAGGAVGTGGAGGSGGRQALGLNDITWLTPLPAATDAVLARATDLASDGKPFLSKALVTQVLTIPGSINSLGGSNPYERLHVVAARFDLCDRAEAGACKDAEDARFRLVFQPIQGAQFDDLGFHVFYSVPRAEVPKVVAALRELAALQAEPLTSPLHVSKGISAGGDYVTKLRALLATYCSEATVVRVTVMGQDLTAAAFRWRFHGIEKTGGSFQEIAILAGGSSFEEVVLLNNTSYDATPKLDKPKGMSLALDEQGFAAAGKGEQTLALDALAQIDNPLINVPNTLSCASCHIATIVLAARAEASGIDPKTLPSAFKTSFDTSVAAGESAENSVILRGLCYRGVLVAISQRVVNETAQALVEINARF